MQLELDKDFELMLVCAVRYALGRSTYIPKLVIEYILKNLDKLSDYCIYIMWRDILEKFDWDESIPQADLWMSFVRRLFKLRPNCNPETRNRSPELLRGE